MSVKKWERGQLPDCLLYEGVCVVLLIMCVCVCVSGSTQVVDERTVTMGFQQWLAGVTERIHQAMHYQFDGKHDAAL